MSPAPRSTRSPPARSRNSSPSSKAPTRSSLSPTTCSRPPGSRTGPGSSTPPARGSPGAWWSSARPRRSSRRRPRRPRKVTSPVSSGEPPPRSGAAAPTSPPGALQGADHRLIAVQQADDLPVLGAVPAGLDRVDERVVQLGLLERSPNEILESVVAPGVGRFGHRLVPGILLIREVEGVVHLQVVGGVAGDRCDIGDFLIGEIGAVGALAHARAGRLRAGRQRRGWEQSDRARPYGAAQEPQAGRTHRNMWTMK